MRVVTYCNIKGDDKVKLRLTDLEHINKKNVKYLQRMGDDILTHWKRMVPRYYTSGTKILSTSDNKAIINGEWQEIPLGYSRPSSGRLKHAGRVSISENSRVTFYLIKIPQENSKQPGWQGADVTSFLAHGTSGGPGAYDPSYGRRKIIRDDQMVWWSCGYHPGTSNKPWLALQREMRSYTRQVVKKYIPKLLRVD